MKSLIVLALLLVLMTSIFFSFNKTIPNISFTTLNSEKMSLEHLRGKPVIVTFWTTDCASCLKEIPLLLDLYQRYHAEGLEIIGVTMYYEPPNHVIEFNKQRPLPYPITLDVEANWAKVFGNVNVTPTTFLLNLKGEIVWQKVGLFELAELQPQIENLLKEK
ncbi:MAG: TlpA disulfide reductase family protein [Methylococcales bacterium]|nr:TlpA disulfide reductase family protein [Methylococcales bacterium]MDD5753403.1 TlpA disulfide reductase family protein [Methylococcales bacterium]